MWAGATTARGGRQVQEASARCHKKVDWMMKKWQHDYVNFTFLAKKNFLQECKIPFNAERLALAAAVSVSSSLSEKVQRQNQLHVFALGLLHTQTHTHRLLFICV